MLVAMRVATFFSELELTFFEMYHLPKPSRKNTTNEHAVKMINQTSSSGFVSSARCSTACTAAELLFTATDQMLSAGRERQRVQVRDRDWMKRKEPIGHPDTSISAADLQGCLMFGKWEFDVRG